MRRGTVALLLFALTLIPNYALANWIAGGNPIATTANQDAMPQVVADGVGGVIVFWQYFNPNEPNDVLAQRVDKDGNELWTPGGVVLTGAGYQSFPQAVSDAQGGAIVSWRDNYYVIVNRIDSDGIVLWTQTLGNGFDGSIFKYAMAPDGDGGVFVSGQPMAGAVHLSASGAVAWAVGYSSSGFVNDGCFVPDGSGGIILAWTDGRRTIEPPPSYLDIYAQRIGITGSSLWNPDGLEIRQDAQRPAMARGAASGAAIVMAIGDWPNHDLVARRVASNGSPVWANDVMVTSKNNDLYSYVIIPDGSDGFLVGWTDYRTDNNGYGDVYAQRLAPDGEVLWQTDGVAVTSEPGVQYFRQLIDDGQGGLIALFGENCCPNGNARIQRISSDGLKPWGESAVVLNATSSQFDGVIARADADAFYCAWADNRSGNWDIYLQRFNIADGSWGTPVSVAITSFRAEVRSDGVKLDATFRSDLGARATNIYRGAGSRPLTILAQSAQASEDHFSYMDRNVSPSTTYHYQLGIIDADGEFRSPVVTVTTPDLDARLEQNHPNPFNPETTIRFSFPVRQRATLEIFSQDGRLVRTLIKDETREAGTYSAEWNGRDNAGVGVSSGVYFYRLTAGKFSSSKKMVLLK